MSSPHPNIDPGLRPDHPHLVTADARGTRQQAAVGAWVLLVGLGMAWGAWSIPSEAGYGGVGPNFLPWLVSLALLACGAVLIVQARAGGWRNLEAGERVTPDRAAFAWVSAGALLNAALITTIGFIPACALAYVLAVQGLRRAYGRPTNTWLTDVLTGLAISAPVFWLFSKFLAINLPGLTATGWI